MEIDYMDFWTQLTVSIESRFTWLTLNLIKVYHSPRASL